MLEDNKVKQKIMQSTQIKKIKTNCISRYFANTPICKNNYVYNYK